MNFSTKNFKRALLAFIGLSLCFSLLFMNAWLGIPIGLFLSISMFYDPKKYEAAKKREEQKEIDDNEVTIEN